MFGWIKKRAGAASQAIGVAQGTALRKQGDTLLAQDDFASAARCYLQAVTFSPRDAAALTSLGFAQSQLGQLAEAMAHLTVAIEADPTAHDPHYLLGMLHEQAGQAGPAITHYRQAVQLAPGFAPAVRDLARVLFQAGRAQEARAALEAGLAHSPDAADLHDYLGNLQMAAGETAQAAASYARAVALAPGHLHAHVNQGLAHEQLGALHAAAASYRLALALDPRHADAHNGLGNVQQKLGRLDEAVACYEAALAADPRHQQAAGNLANALLESRQMARALPCYEHALVLNPQSADLMVNLGHVLNHLKRPLDALAAYERAMALDARAPWVLGAWLHTRMRICDWRGIDAAFARLAEGIDRGERVAVPFTMLAAPLSAARQHQCARTYFDQLGLVQVPTPVPAAAPAGQPPARIRLGYFSADLHNHATAYLMAELFERHDRERFEVIAFSFGPPSTHPMRARLLAAFDDFIDVAALSDAQIAERARALKIDIAIDLKGYTEDCRTGIFAHRAAPVQVSYIGYPGTMGAPCIDYLLADATVVPPEHAAHFTEQIAWLPHSYQANDSRREISPRVLTREEAGLPAQGFVFCCFNNNYKITPEVFAAWMRLLQAVPASVLWLLQDNPHAADNLRQHAQAHGVDPARLVFAPRVDMPEHLARQRLAGLFLDTLHCNAHTTASDALWAGLPVLTCLGQAFAGRVAASLVRAAGLPELAVDSLQEYEALALALATDAPRLAALRERLQATRLSCPLFDAQRLTGHIEAAYTAMWQRHLAGLAPGPIHVPA